LNLNKLTSGKVWQHWPGTETSVGKREWPTADPHWNPTVRWCNSSRQRNLCI